MIQWIQSRRALGVMSDHNVRAFGATARAFFRSGGTSGSVSFPAGAISSMTMSPASAPADLLSFRSTLSQWLFWPVGFERGLKRHAIDGAFDRGHATRGKLRASSLWQDEKGPGA